MWYTIIPMKLNLSELSELNISDGQIRVYEGLLELGQSGIQNIQEKTGLERRAIYDVLNKLIEKGLVTYITEKGIKKYQTTHPKILQELIDKKQVELRLLNDKMPDIIDLFKSKKLKINAEVYRGNSALKALLNESLENEATYWIGGNSGIEDFAGTDMKFWFKQWTRRRVEKKRLMYDLVDFGSYLEDFKPGDIDNHKKNYYKYCTLPEDLKSPIVVLIFGNKVAQVLWSKQPFAFVMESKEVKESFMKYFNYFWKNPW